MPSLKPYALAVSQVLSEPLRSWARGRVPSCRVKLGR